MSDWQPIDTAPKDGTIIAIFCPDRKPRLKFCMARWINGWGWLSTPSDQQRRPTLWLRIDPPVQP